MLRRRRKLSPIELEFFPAFPSNPAIHRERVPMKNRLALLLASIVGLGTLTPATADAKTVIIVKKHHHHHRHYKHRHVWVPSHFVFRVHHRVLIPGHFIVL